MLVIQGNTIEERLNNLIINEFSHIRFHTSKSIALNENCYLPSKLRSDIFNISMDIAQKMLTDSFETTKQFSYKFDSDKNCFLSRINIQVTKLGWKKDYFFSEGCYTPIENGSIDPSTGKMKPLDIDVDVYMPDSSLTSYLENIHMYIATALNHELMHAYEDYCIEKKTGKPFYQYRSRYETNRKQADKLAVLSVLEPAYDEIAHMVYAADRLEQNAFISDIIGELDAQHRLPYKTKSDVATSIKNTSTYKDFERINDFVQGTGEYQTHNLYSVLKSREDKGVLDTLEYDLSRMFNTGWNSSHTADEWYNWIKAFWHRVSQRFQHALVIAAARYYDETNSSQRVY